MRAAASAAIISDPSSDGKSLAAATTAYQETVSDPYALREYLRLLSRCHTAVAYDLLTRAVNVAMADKRYPELQAEAAFALYQSGDPPFAEWSSQTNPAGAADQPARPPTDPMPPADYPALPPTNPAPPADHPANPPTNPNPPANL